MASSQMTLAGGMAQRNSCLLTRLVNAPQPASQRGRVAADRAPAGRKSDLIWGCHKARPTCDATLKHGLLALPLGRGKRELLELLLNLRSSPLVARGRCLQPYSRGCHGGAAGVNEAASQKAGQEAPGGVHRLTRRFLRQVRRGRDPLRPTSCCTHLPPRSAGCLCLCVAAAALARYLLERVHQGWPPGTI
jgi:hypothetical protein